MTHQSCTQKSEYLCAIWIRDEMVDKEIGDKTKHYIMCEKNEKCVRICIHICISIEKNNKYVKYSQTEINYARQNIFRLEYLDFFRNKLYARVHILPDNRRSHLFSCYTFILISQQIHSRIRSAFRSGKSAHHVIHFRASTHFLKLYRGVEELSTFNNSGARVHQTL